ncbi:hypothetical protein WH5701_12213 [Synechococcus sp. WH 5701]|nr:hypothetical protein WH5701_12213 [Synechococcus sp. WH 5701]
MVVQLQWPAEAEDEDDNDDNAEGLE